MSHNSRRHFIKNLAAGTLAGAFASAAQAQTTLTPREMEGPYYPITPQKDQDADLTRVAGKSGVAQGTHIEIAGQVFDHEGNTVEDVTLDLWQANAFGKYHHPHDTSEAPVDEHFQAWAIIQSGKQGRFRFKTVFPGAYPLNASSQRTPHIHLKASKLGYDTLLTQLYFPDHPLNHKDGLFKRKSAHEQALMTVKRTERENHYLFNLVIQKIPL
ncbi:MULTISPECIES: protocatechuate 3,4-dioxygenase [unclassified Pseudoalteromonas]|uniref:dioxygenase family protein n=1 Tax=unclassified Pseudoalteromonas TaxID=194690 RepID=UPI002097A315|nr:protocatechuate 3,4-dioxygenase [Pseudoalteromonas sp. XMcav2-N]MCO7189107.1 protocatechuate 3,4-dioxygenase [Pseudoalteromonas sp. XMcav2-N]